MFFFHRNRFILKKQRKNQFESLQVQSQNASLKQEKRMSLSASLQGSLTVEAALIIPIFLFAITTVISIAQLFLTKEKVEQALSQTAKHQAKYAYALEFKERTDLGESVGVGMAYGTTTFFVI